MTTAIFVLLGGASVLTLFGANRVAKSAEAARKARLNRPRRAVGVDMWAEQVKNRRLMQSERWGSPYGRTIDLGV